VAVPATPAKRGSRARLIAIAVALVLLGVLAYALGLDEWLDRERIRSAVESAGPWGFLIFTALFSVGELVHVPGWVFIGVATLLWGSLLGGIVSYVAGLVSVSVAFLLVRRAGGQALTSIERPWMKKALLRLETRPVLTVVVLRLFLFMTPAVNYALALTPLRFRDFLLGSALGLIPGVILFASGAAALFGWG
jgi:uncharacterized membrane protein YdjX (TVP38/TMEM64 family)